MIPAPTKKVWHCEARKPFHLRAKFTNLAKATFRLRRAQGRAMP